MVKEDPLYESSKKYSKAILVYLRKTIKSEDIPITIVKKVKMGEGRSYSSYLESIPDYHIIIYKNQKNLMSIKEFEMFKRDLLNNKYIIKHINKMISTSTSGRRFDLEQLFLTFVFHVLNRMPNLKFNNKVFDELYIKFINSFKQRKFKFSAVTLLNNFNSDHQSINLDKNLKVRKITNEEYERLLGGNVLTPSISDLGFNLLSINYLMELKYTENKIITDPSKKIDFSKKDKINASQIFNDVVSCMRLIKPGNIYFNAIHYQQIDNIVFPFGSSSQIGYTKKGFGPGIHFSGNESNALKKLYLKYKLINFSKHKKLGIAIERYNLALERRNSEDKIIDYIIALESLLITEDKRVFYKLPILVSKELKEYYSQKEVSNLIKNAIIIRNNILHANKIDKNIADIINKLCDYTSLIIQDKIKRIKIK